jgi:hypothetical protein
MIIKTSFFTAVFIMGVTDVGGLVLHSAAAGVARVEANMRREFPAISSYNPRRSLSAPSFYNSYFIVLLQQLNDLFSNRVIPLLSNKHNHDQEPALSQTFCPWKSSISKGFFMLCTVTFKSPPINLWLIMVSPSLDGRHNDRACQC